MAENLSINSETAYASISLQGGCITSYGVKDDIDLDILRSYEGPTEECLPGVSSSYPLVPYSNRIKHGKFSYDNESYVLPLNFGEHPHSIHGVAWQNTWKVISHEADKIIIALDYAAGDWPFDFLATQSFQLDGSSLLQEIVITNKSQRKMPVGMGMHPYFPKRNRTKLQADVTKVWMTDETCIPTNLVDCPIDWNLKQGVQVNDITCDNQFEIWNGVATITWPEENLSVELTASSNLDRLVVYVPQGRNHFCVEPVSHITNAFNHNDHGLSAEGAGVKHLSPEEVYQGWMKFTPKY